MPHSSGEGFAGMPDSCNPHPRIVIPPFLPAGPKRPGAVVLNVVLILHLPFVTMQNGTPVPNCRSKSLMSSVVHEPSGQSSVVRRYDKRTWSASPSQAGFSPLATALIFTSSLPALTLPLLLRVTFPEPLDVNAQRPGTAGAQAGLLSDWVAVLGVKQGKKPLTRANSAFCAFAGSVWLGSATPESRPTPATADMIESERRIGDPPSESPREGAVG